MSDSEAVGKEFIEHFGVKGMKWGVRRSRTPSRQGLSDDAKTARKALKKTKKSGVQSLTNKELKALNERLNLEQNYKRLTYKPNALKKGFDVVSKTLDAGKTVNTAIEFSKTPLGKQLASSIKKKK